MRSVFVSIFAVAYLFGQEARTLSFESVTLKPSGPKSYRGSEGGPQSSISDHYSAGRATLAELLMLAYGFKERDQVMGPPWLDAAQFDIEVKAPSPMASREFRSMLQDLLIERFRLRVRLVTKSLPTYELQVAGSGVKLGQSVKAELTENDAEIGTPGKNGFPRLSAKKIGARFDGGVERSRIAAHWAPISSLAEMLGIEMKRPVIDRTGLAGPQDYTLEFDPRPAGKVPVRNPGPSLSQALEDQLGLMLVETKIEAAALVVDSALRTPVTAKSSKTK